MGKHRLLYQLLLISALVFYTLYPRWFSWYLLVLVLLLIPFDLICSLPGMFSWRILITSPKMLKQGADGALAVTTLRKRPLPVGRLKIRLRETGEEGTRWRRMRCYADHGARYEMAIDTSRSGFTAFDLNRFWATSLLGLFSLPVAAESRAGVLVLPPPQIPPRAVQLPRVAVLRPEQSGTFSEDHDLRPFRQGDPLKSVHWKLSAKYDALIVREPLIPTPHSRLIHVEVWRGVRERDIILGRLWWVSEYLLKRGLHYFVRLGEEGPVEHITREVDLVDYLLRMLDEKAPQPLAHPSLPSRFSWVFRVDGESAAEHRGRQMRAES